MSYGLKVNNSIGAPRIYDGTWSFKFYGYYSVYAGEGHQEVKVEIPGFNPETWGLQIVGLIPDKEYVYVMSRRVKKEINAVYFYGSNFSGVRYNFNVFKGD